MMGIGTLQFGKHPSITAPARELARDQDARALIEFAELSYRLARPFAAPPGVPTERAKALQQAFVAVHNDPQYLDEAVRLRLEVSPIGGREVLDAIGRIAAAPPHILDRLKRLMADRKGGG